MFWPCGWSAALATSPGTFPDLYILGTMLVGSFVMRGAGCTINDMWDRKIDRKVLQENNLIAFVVLKMIIILLCRLNEQKIDLLPATKLNH